MTPERVREIANETGWPPRLVAPIIMAKLHEFAEAIRREALEEAARVCDRLAADMYDDGARPAAGAAWDCASAIRALADAPDAGAGG